MTGAAHTTRPRLTILQLVLLLVVLIALGVAVYEVIQGHNDLADRSTTLATVSSLRTEINHHNAALITAKANSDYLLAQATSSERELAHAGTAWSQEYNGFYQDMASRHCNGHPKPKACLPPFTQPT